MMNCSENCPHWAQWRVTVPEKDGDGKILRLKTIAILCGQHKNAMEKASAHAEPKVDLRFNFVGAIPDGSYHSQP